jgi:hypothetical protein
MEISEIRSYKNNNKSDESVGKRGTDKRTSHENYLLVV